MPDPRQFGFTLSVEADSVGDLLRVLRAIELDLIAGNTCCEERAANHFAYRYELKEVSQHV